MKGKWMLVVAACMGLGLVSVPFWPRSSSLPSVSAQDRPAQAAAGVAGGVCDAGGKPAPGFTLKDMNGADVSLADYKGQVVLLNFWATWCGPCKFEIPGFVKLQDKYRSQGVAFLGLSVDDPMEKLKPFAEKYRINYPLLVGLGHEDVQDAYGPIYGIPITVMIDRKGNICKTHTGLASEAQLEREISALL